MSMVINGNNIEGMLLMGTLSANAKINGTTAGYYYVSANFPEWMPSGYGYLFKPSSTALNGAFYLRSTGEMYYYCNTTVKWEKVANTTDLAGAMPYRGTIPSNADATLASGYYYIARDNYPSWIPSAWGFLFKPDDSTLNGAWYLSYPSTKNLEGLYFYSNVTGKFERLARVSDLPTTTIGNATLCSDLAATAHVEWIKNGNIAQLSGELPFSNGIAAGEIAIAMDLPKFAGSACYQHAIDHNGNPHLMKVDNNGKLYITNPTAITGAVHIYLGLTYIAQ